MTFAKFSKEKGAKKKKKSKCVIIFEKTVKFQQN